MRQMLGADADGVLLVRQGDATTQMTCYRLSPLSHVFDAYNTLYPLQPSYQISAIGRSFAKLQKDLQHQTILFLIALYVQRFYLYAVKGQITGNIGYGTGAIGSNDADKLAVAAVVGSKTLFPGMKGNQSYHGDNGCHTAKEVHTAAGSKTDCGNHPQAGSSCQAADS